MRQYTKLKQWKFTRYLPFLKYNTFKKDSNLLHSIILWILGKTNINSKPAFLRVEISRLCKVNCLYCYEKKESLFYPYDLYKRLIDSLKDYIFLVSLYEIGEPLENEKIIDYILYAKSNKIGTIISTNLSIEKNDTFWENLVISGLDRIVISIDGITPEIYNKYRRQGNLKLVFTNLNKILYYKRLHASRILVEWQMIDFPWNKGEQEKAKEYALNIGCNEFRVIQEVTKIRMNYKFTDFIRRQNCILTYFTFNVTAYNTVRPCTKIYNDPMIIGDLNTESFNDVWNGSEISKIRSKYKIQSRVGCKTCPE
jgi:radical SAM protein with 4Fe4S-binding SPASM domain